MATGIADVFESLVVTYALSHKWEIVEANGNAEAITGFTKEELVGRPLWDRVHSSESAKILGFTDRLKSYYKNEEQTTLPRSMCMVYRYTKKDGAVVYLQTSVVAAKSPPLPGTVPFLFVTQDITQVHIDWAQESIVEKKRAVAAEDRMKKSEEQQRDMRQRLAFLEQVLDSTATDNVAFVLDRDARFTQWSADAARILGYHESEVLNYDITHTKLLEGLQDTQVVIKCAVEDTFRRASSPNRRSSSPQNRRTNSRLGSTGGTQDGRDGQPSSPASMGTSPPSSPYSPSSSSLHQNGFQDMRDTLSNVNWTLRCADGSLQSFSFQTSPVYQQSTGSCIGMLVTGQSVKTSDRNYVHVLAQLVPQLYEKKDLNFVLHELLYMANQSLGTNIAAVFEGITTTTGVQSMTVESAIAFRSPQGTVLPPTPGHRQTLEFHVMAHPEEGTRAINDMDQAVSEFPGHTLASNSLEDGRIQSALAAPIRYHNSTSLHSSPYGVVAVYSTAGHVVFTDEEVSFLTCIAGLMSAVIDIRVADTRLRTKDDMLRDANLALEHAKRKVAQSAVKKMNGPISPTASGNGNPSPKPRAHVAPNQRAQYKKATKERQAAAAASAGTGGAGGHDKRSRADPRAPIPGVDPKLQEVICQEIMHSQGQPLSWDDVSGLELAKQALMEMVILPSQYPQVFTGLRSPPKGLLLFGPPGNGKTLLAKTVAQQSNSVFFAVSASSLTSKWVGEGEKLVRALFQVAKHVQPAIIFIDEIDSILTKRRENEHESSRRLKTEFLVQFDGALTSSEDKVIVMGATNRPQELDDAARRRLVKRVYIPLPSREGRKALILRMMKEEPFDMTDEELEMLLDQTECYSGHDLTMLCKDAAYGALRELTVCNSLDQVAAGQVRGITYEDFRNSLGNVRPSVSKDQLSDFEKWNSEFGTVVQVARSTASRPEDNPDETQE